MSNYEAVSFDAIQAAVHGLDGSRLPFAYHTDTLHPGDAETLNAAYDFIVVGGTHGWGKGKSSPASPTDIEYDAAAQAVAELDGARGDVLFLENVGHGNTPLYTGAAGNGSARLREDAERGREERTIHAFRYAGLLAAAEGVAVWNADIGAEMTKAYLRGIDVSLRQAVTAPSPYYAPTMHVRNEQAVYCAKDYTLEQVQQNPNDGISSGDSKRKAMILFGGAHVEATPGAVSIPDVLGSLSLNAEVRILPDSQEERKAKQEIPPPPDITNMTPEEAAAATVAYTALVLTKYATFLG